MKPLGISVTMDSFGRITIPKSLRLTMGFEPTTPLEMLADGSGLRIQNHLVGCMFCRSDIKVVAWHGSVVCRACASDILAKSVKDTCEYTSE